MQCATQKKITQEKFQLKVNMRLQMLQDQTAETFSKQLLDIGDGKVIVDETNGSLTRYFPVYSHNTLIMSGC